MNVLATYSIKGGVGKTTSAVNLAFEASRQGARVLVWDLDPQGAATFFFRIKPKLKGGTERLVSGKGALAAHVRATDLAGVHIVPADFSLRHLDLHLGGRKRPTERLASLLEAVADHYDVAILDCPPSISLASESIFGATDHLLVPVIPTTLSSRTLAQLAGFLDDRPGAPRLLPYLSMVDRRKRLHRDLVDSLRREWPDLLTSVIPGASVIERMGPERAPVAVFAPSSPAARAFRSLWAEVAIRLWN
ncbi:MAG: ParA family protein [Actinomycetota bacterium]|nr:ParA family protein [Actinomycetota bacterium]